MSQVIDRFERDTPTLRAKFLDFTFLGDFGQNIELTLPGDSMHTQWEILNFHFAFDQQQNKKIS